MRTKMRRIRQGILAASALLVMAAGTCLSAMDGHLIDGITGPSFTLTAKSGYLSTADGNSVYFWGYANGTAPAQYVGPTLIVEQGAAVTVALTNALPVPASIVFPGQAGVVATGGTTGLLTQEAAASGGTVTYTFTATDPGTYMYHSGTQPDLQIEMGLVGALIVRPTGFDHMDMMTWKAYAHDDSMFDQEYLFVCTEMDERIHDRVELQVKRGHTIAADTTKWFPVYWFLNGRTGPDTMLPPAMAYLPAQPYDCMPMCKPGERVLLRLVGGGRDPHPFHHHGNHSSIIARDGRLLSSGEPGAGADLSQMVFTIPVTPGGTTDSIWSWTGEKLGWDVYGHVDGDALAPNEYAPDHGKPFPVVLPPNQDLTFGQGFGGSPFLGTAGALPPGQGGLNPTGGFLFMWHSHAEKELCNNDLFPGGMLTMGVVLGPAMPMP